MRCRGPIPSTMKIRCSQSRSRASLWLSPWWYLSFLLVILILIESIFYTLVVSLTIFIMIDYKPASSAPGSEPGYGALCWGEWRRGDVGTQCSGYYFDSVTKNNDLILTLAHSALFKWGIQTKISDGKWLLPGRRRADNAGLSNKTSQVNLFSSLIFSHFCCS